MRNPPLKARPEPQNPDQIKAEIEYLESCLERGGNGVFAEAIRDRIATLNEKLTGGKS